MLPEFRHSPRPQAIGLAVAGRSQKELEQAELELELGAGVGPHIRGRARLGGRHLAQGHRRHRQVVRLKERQPMVCKFSNMMTGIRSCSTAPTLHGVHYLDLSGNSSFIRNAKLPQHIARSDENHGQEVPRLFRKSAHHPMRLFVIQAIATSSRVEWVEYLFYRSLRTPDEPKQVKLKWPG